MAILKGKVTSAKEHAGMVWLHVSGRQGSGWVSVSKDIFDDVYKKELLEQLYSKHNRLIEKKILVFRKEMKKLKKEEGREFAVKDKEEQIKHLKNQMKNELHVHELSGREIRFRIE